MPIFVVGVNNMQLMDQLDLLTSLISGSSVSLFTRLLLIGAMIALIFFEFLCRACLTRQKSPLFLFPASRGNISEAERCVICVLDYVFFF